MPKSYTLPQNYFQSARDLSNWITIAIRMYRSAVSFPCHERLSLRDLDAKLAQLPLIRWQLSATDSNQELSKRKFGEVKVRVTEGNAVLIFQLMEFSSKDWVSSLEGGGFGVEHLHLTGICEIAALALCLPLLVVRCLSFQWADESRVLTMRHILLAKYIASAGPSLPLTQPEELTGRNGAWLLLCWRKFYGGWVHWLLNASVLFLALNEYIFFFPHIFPGALSCTPLFWCDVSRDVSTGASASCQLTLSFNFSRMPLFEITNGDNYPPISKYKQTLQVAPFKLVYSTYRHLKKGR